MEKKQIENVAKLDRIKVIQVLFSVLGSLCKKAKPGEIHSLSSIADLVDLGLKRYTKAELAELQPNKWGPQSAKANLAENGGYYATIRAYTDDILQGFAFGSRGMMGLRSGTGCPVIEDEAYRNRLLKAYGVEVRGENKKELEVSRRSLPLWSRVYRQGRSRCEGGVVALNTDKPVVQQ